MSVFKQKKIHYINRQNKRFYNTMCDMYAKSS